MEMPLHMIPTPDQCAGAVLFMASELAAAVTGQHLSVNGGQWTT
jgi:NAD(P)-dependent dehydrogenase (short-subunit alcohol dehydrogenase family)